MLTSPKTATKTVSANGWQGEMPAILCPNEPTINIGRRRQPGRPARQWATGKGTQWEKRFGGGRDESLGRMFKKLGAAELTSHFQLFHQRRSKVVIVAAKDILSELSIFLIF